MKQKLEYLIIFLFVSFLSACGAPKGANAPIGSTSWCEYKTNYGQFENSNCPIDTLYSPKETLLSRFLALIPSILFFVLIIGVYVIVLRYVWRTSIKTGRSRNGFILFAIFFPIFAGVILLILDKDEKRINYSNTS